MDSKEKLKLDIKELGSIIEKVTKQVEPAKQLNSIMEHTVFETIRSLKSARVEKATKQLESVKELIFKVDDSLIEAIRCLQEAGECVRKL
jgi:hypothetical protein